MTETSGVDMHGGVQLEKDIMLEAIVGRGRDASRFVVLWACYDDFLSTIATPTYRCIDEEGFFVCKHCLGHCKILSVII